MPKIKLKNEDFRILAELVRVEQSKECLKFQQLLIDTTSENFVFSRPTITDAYKDYLEDVNMQQARLKAKLEYLKLEYVDDEYEEHVQELQELMDEISKLKTKSSALYRKNAYVEHLSKLAGALESKEHDHDLFKFYDTDPPYDPSSTPEPDPDEQARNLDSWGY